MISFNLLLIVYLSVYLASSAGGLLIERINANHLKKSGDRIPEAFKGTVDKEELKRINQYTFDNTNFSLVETIAGDILFLFIILSGILPWLAKPLSQFNFVLAGLIFFAIPALLSAAMDLPFGYYHSFVLEERYGFNTTTLKIWVSDLLKALVLGCILGGILLSSLLLMVKYAGNTWWIWAWAIFLGFQLLMTVLYPTVIAPLFNKFTPLEDPDLIKRIEELAEREGLSIKGIYQMDATKRSKHTNAYFSGLGKAKRIVLFDSLIQAHDTDEIVAVLAHEIGHFKKNHIKKQLAITAVASFLLFYLASRMITWEAMYQSFGFSVMPAYAGIFLVGVLWQPAGFFLSPMAMSISRRFEREADLYCMRITKSSEPLIRALKKMAKENLSNLLPHPLYVWFNYSHPPLVERIKRLEGYDVPRP
ncbi:MAG: M48 family metallopeptidase [Desulfatiglandaceae bacterium]